MRISPRIFAVGFGQNLASFLAWSIIPVWSEFVRHAPTWQLGLLPLPSGIAYVAVSLRAGPLSDRIGRATLARIGMAGFAVFCVLAWLAPGVPILAALGALNGASLALVWPAMQARIGDESTADDLERNLGSFSISWSAGKTAGFLAFGLVYRELGLGKDALLLCALLSLLFVPVLRKGAGRHRDAPPLVRDDHHPPALRAAHLRVGWWANFASYGMGATMVYMYPPLLRASGRGAADYGVVLGTIYFAQTAGFLLFGRFAGWRYRLAPVAGWMAAGAGALMLLGFGAPLAAAVPAAAVLGLALGQAYSASVYYSVHSEEKRGARAGIHEAVIGAADCGLPLLAGLAVWITGWIPAAFVLAAAVAGIALLAAARAVRRVPTSASA
jgi:MFS family permease